MLKIAVVEDQQEVRDELCRFIRQYAAENSLQVEVLPIEDGAVIAEHYEPGYDIIFMDVEMPGLDGFGAAVDLQNGQGIAAVAAFQPIPCINVYAATKAFVLYFSRALNRELKKRGITVTAVCPFWTKTEFFNRAVSAQSDAVVKKYTAMYRPEQIVTRAGRDAKRGKDVSNFGFVARAQAGLCKLLPHSLIMTIWQKQQKLD